MTRRTALFTVAAVVAAWPFTGRLAAQSTERQPVSIAVYEGPN